MWGSDPSSLLNPNPPNYVFNRVKVVFGWGSPTIEGQLVFIYLQSSGVLLEVVIILVSRIIHKLIGVSDIDLLRWPIELFLFIMTNTVRMATINCKIHLTRRPLRRNKELGGVCIDESTLLPCVFNCTTLLLQKVFQVRFKPLINLQLIRRRSVWQYTHLRDTLRLSDV